jgi:hypothetical protein
MTGNRRVLEDASRMRSVLHTEEPSKRHGDMLALWAAAAAPWILCRREKTEV